MMLHTLKLSGTMCASPALTALHLAAQAPIAVPIYFLGSSLNHDTKYGAIQLVLSL